MTASAKMPNYRGSIKPLNGERSPSASLTDAITTTTSTRHSRSKESRSGVKANVGGKRRPARRDANVRSKQAQRRQEHLKKPSGSTKPRSKRSRKIALLSTSGL